MKKLKKSCLAVLLFSLYSTSYAAQELSPEKADALISYKEISIRGAYNSDIDAAKAISKAADKDGAAYFYITSINNVPSNDSLRIVYAKLYKNDAAQVDEEKTTNFRQFNAVYEYPKTTAVHFEPYDMIRLRGYYPTQHQLNNAVSKEAAKKGAYAFYIDRAVEVNGGNTAITAYLFKKDAPKRLLQPENAIPYDSQAGQQALAQGGDAAAQVERPGYYSSTAFNEQHYADKFNNKDNPASTNTTLSTSENKSVVPKSSSTRYTVTLSDGTKIEELNDATAMKMVPFDSIKFRGYFVTEQQVSYNAAKKAAEKGAKYYHISRIAEDTRGPNRTIYVDLYR